MDVTSQGQRPFNIELAKRDVAFRVKDMAFVKTAVLFNN